MSPGSWSALLFALCGGCAPIRRDVKIVDYPEGTRHVDRVVEGSHRYHAAADITDDNLVITLTQVEICEDADVPILRRKRMTSKTEIPSLLGIQGEWLSGAGGLILGGLMAVNPERACSQTSQDGSSDMTDPQTCVVLGWSLVGLGAVLTTIAIVDSIRVSDEEQDLGTHEGEYTASRRDCHAGPVSDTAVELRLGTEAIHRGKTSQSGEVAFSMFDVEGGALPSPEHPASIAIGGDVAPVAVTEQQYQVLVRNLRDNPHSRLAARDLELARSACDAQVDGAARLQVKPDSADTELAAAQGAWQHAKLACGAQWSPDHQQRLDAVQKAIADNRIAAALLALKSGQLDRLVEVLGDDPVAARRFRDDPDLVQPLRSMVGEPTRRALLARGGDRAEAQRQLCRARSVFVRIWGQQAWDQLKVGVASNVSELGGGAPANIVRIMDAVRCD
jgi:hypothetical protein